MGKSLEELLPDLSDQPLPTELKLADGEETGANAYKRHLLKLHQMLGRLEVEKRLN